MRYVSLLILNFMLQMFLAVLVFVGLSVLIMSFRLLFVSGGKFPDNRIGHSKKMRKMGIYCPNTVDKMEQKSCAGCNFLEQTQKLK